MGEEVEKVFTGMKGMKGMFTSESLVPRDDQRLIFRLPDPAGMGFASQSRLPWSHLQAHLQE
jgi:hypothetical protein